jgi:hypothetical protein
VKSEDDDHLQFVANLVREQLERLAPGEIPVPLRERQAAEGWPEVGRCLPSCAGERASHPEVIQVGASTNCKTTSMGHQVSPARYGDRKLYWDQTVMKDRENDASCPARA